jgi:CheY-like chemotaxis protein
MASSEQETWTGEDGGTPSAVRILLYSDHPETREQVRAAVGTRPAADLPRVEWVEAATGPAALGLAERGGFGLLVLDGEAGKTGGMGLCRQLKDEVFDLPPVLLLVARQQDAWLASWAEPDEVVAQPIDPFTFADVVAGLVRGARGQVRA